MHIYVLKFPARLKKKKKKHNPWNSHLNFKEINLIYKEKKMFSDFCASLSDKYHISLLITFPLSKY